MKRIQYILCSFLVIFLMIPPLTVSADIGPKPSVVIEFSGLEDELYYVTLLSEKESTGPWSLGNEYYEYMGDESVFQKFSSYEDKDGYYFLSFMEDCSDDDIFEWTYYPPESFKILIYFPEYDTFLTDETVYERYAFDSYFTVKVNENNFTTLMDDEKETSIETNKSYNYFWEIVSLIARILLTIIIEILLALLFYYKNKKALKIIAYTNIFTQILLNVLLNIANYRSGQYAFVFHYIWMEIAVIVIEAIVYDRLIARKEEMRKEEMRKEETGNKRYRALWYAIIANVFSFVIGMVIAKMIPGIF